MKVLLELVWLKSVELMSVLLELVWLKSVELMSVGAGCKLVRLMFSSLKILNIVAVEFSSPGLMT